ncbi:hypothetical protein HPB52_000266 [Rhipicephalus sanguineus]|uniref:CCHC-type domain-containing protein n=1 Tax=Rhipicephalus sanguineus TaxID=34632 RepID=A0A9D4STF7_RHISA|nr:hypothetical protein HPB52_000266 [Rhipicephalus sanguineus]
MNGLAGVNALVWVAKTNSHSRQAVPSSDSSFSDHWQVGLSRRLRPELPIATTLPATVTASDATVSTVTMDTDASAQAAALKAPGKRLPSQTAMDLHSEHDSVPNAKRACTTPSLRSEKQTPTPYKAVIKARACVDSTIEQLKQIAPSVGQPVPVQAYLASGVDLRRYVVAGVDPREDQDTLRRELFCPQHTIVAARHMGKSDDVHYGCVLRPRPFKPAVIFCYGCYRKGHMKASCPNTQSDADMDATAGSNFRCGLCKCDDHDITSPQCPTKRNATRELRHKRQQSSHLGGASVLHLNNSFEILADLEPDDSHITEATSFAEKKSYSAAVKEPRKKLSPTNSALPASQMETPDDLVSLDTRLARLQQEIDNLRRRRELLAKRAASSSTPQHDTNVQPIQQPRSSSADLTPMELLQFVAKQLMSLTQVLASNLLQ